MEGTGCESMWIPPFSSVSSEENDVARLCEEVRQALAPYLARCASSQQAEASAWAEAATAVADAKAGEAGEAGEAAEREAAEAEAARHGEELLALIEAEEAAAAKRKGKKKKKGKGCAMPPVNEDEVAVVAAAAAAMDLSTTQQEADDAGSSASSSAASSSFLPLSAASHTTHNVLPRPPESSMGGESTCIACFTRSKSHAAVPCGHMCACKQCSSKMSTCPLCRAEVVMWLHVMI